MQAPSAMAGVISCHPPLLVLPPGTWGHTGNPRGWPRDQVDVDGSWEGEGHEVWPFGAVKVASQPLPFIPSSPRVGRHTGKPWGGSAGP